MPEAPRRRRVLAWSLVVAWCLVILGLSSIPGIGERLPEALRFPLSDKLAHAFVYGVLGALLANATGRWLPAVLVASAFGALDELYQGTVPGRTPNPLDWVADTVGAAIGAALVVRFSRRRRDRVVQ